MPRKTISSGELGALQTAMQETGNAVVIDIGAHEGEYVGLMRGHFPSFQFHSFEPDPQSFAKMNDNLVKRFGEGHGVTTNNQAIAKHNGAATLYTHQIGAANSSLAHRELSHLAAKFDLEQTVQTKTLRSYCDQNNIEIIDYLKIDTEGTEFDIIESVMPMIEENRIRFIQFEYGSCNVDTRTYLKDFYLLLRHKYNFYRIHPEGLYPCNEYQEAYECFNLCNYVLERYA
jgi:FkbM family methyltransferase